MDFVILYFSGTGNTELITKEIKQRLEIKGNTVEVVSIEDREQLENISYKDKIIGFGYPVYKYSYPDIFNKVLPLLERIANNQKCFLFATYARFTGYAMDDFSKRLNKLGFRIIAENCFKAPSCGIESRRAESGFEWEAVMFFENDIRCKLDLFVDEILIAKVLSRKTGFKLQLPPKRIVRAIVIDVERTNYPMLQIDKGKCTVCGLCAKKCPDHNLVKEQNQIKILSQYECLHCLRCMNRCPANAIYFGKLTKGNNHYTPELRNRLYEKAASGYHEKHWENFEDIILNWRKNTLSYWRGHRKNPEI